MRHVPVVHRLQSFSLATDRTQSQINGKTVVQANAQGFYQEVLEKLITNNSAQHLKLRSRRHSKRILMTSHR